ncbi:MAG: AMP-binding protein, partial [Thiovulaceae bacterium]|nr:AMP-binding protein [Sulfurimonadaceae bacterium]
NLFYIVGFVAFGMVILAVKKLPQAMLRLFAYFVISRRYKVDVTGFENLPKEGGVLLIGNHVSWIDWIIISMASVRRIHFVMERAIYEKWYVKMYVRHFNPIPISTRGGAKAREMIQQRLGEGEVVCIFPEGVISRNGHLGEFYKGFERFAKNAKGVIVPFYMQGLWGTAFSRSTKKLRANTKTAGKRNIVVAFGKALPIESSRVIVKKAVFELSFVAWRRYSDSFNTIQYSWLKMAKKRKKALAVADTLGTELSSQRLLTGTLLFAKEIKKISPEKYIGLMLPTTAGGVIANMATLVNGKVVCNLNYTAGERAIRAAIEKADIKTLYTAHAFVDKLKDRGLDVNALGDVVNIIYLEDIKKNLSKVQSLLMLLCVKFLPTAVLKALYFKDAHIDDTAEIMFSSGSEGEPKGIELTHRNVITNARQISSVANIQDDDIFMSVLPLFHAMGLNIMAIKPLIEGVPFICHPDPTDGESIGKAIAKYKATVLVSTSTFYRIYTKNKKVHPLMFESLRLTVAGAEKLTDDVAREVKEKFGKTILQGYGATETSPVAGCNMPDHLDTDYWIVQTANKPGTV